MGVSAAVVTYIAPEHLRHRDLAMGREMLTYLLHKTEMTGHVRSVTMSKSSLE
jgi:hypothetical protein